MRSLDTIRAEDENKAIKAANDNLTPLFIGKHDDVQNMVRNLPTIHGLEHEGWEATRQFVLESTIKAPWWSRSMDYGRFFKRFCKTIKVGYGYGITEDRSTWITITQFKKEGKGS